jgi:zinc protease
VRAPIFLVLALASCAGRNLPDEPIFSPRHFPQTDQQLPSGLRVVIQEDHTTPLVTVAAIYGVGTTADPQEAGGLAHLVEHLTFRARDEAASVAERIERVGATFNAQTGPDTTLFYSVAQRDAVEELLQVEIARPPSPAGGSSASCRPPGGRRPT